MREKSLDAAVHQALGPFLTRHAFVALGDCESSGMGEAYMVFENPEFRMVISRDRGGHEAIEIGSKKRPRPRAHMREWSLGHLRGFLEGGEDCFVFVDLEAQARWLIENDLRLLDSDFLNSDEVQKWAVAASRRRWQ